MPSDSSTETCSYPNCFAPAEMLDHEGRAVCKNCARKAQELYEKAPKYKYMYCTPEFFRNNKSSNKEDTDE